MPDKKKKLILIDANALMHRAYHALPPLATKKGELVNAVYGFTSVLLKVIKDLKPDYMICAFDVGGGTFRDKLYKEYKAGRVKPGQEFYNQIPKIKEIIRAFNIPVVEKQGFEADDIIGSLAFQAEQMPKNENQKLETIIVTGDLDTLQLIDDHTSVYTLKKGINDTVVYDKKAVEERYGLKPNQIVDFKALRGDPSDNIPGVKGIGEKGAIELLRNFGSLENLYKVLEKDKTNSLIKPKIKEKLVEQKKEAFLSKELAAIKLDAGVNLDLEKSVWGDYDKKKLNSLFRELEFYSLTDRAEKANRVMGHGTRNMEQVGDGKRVKYIILDDEEKINKFLAELGNHRRFVFETGKRGESAAEEKLAGLVFSWEENSIYYIPMNLKDAKPDLFSAPERAAGSSLEKFKSILENEKYKKIGYFFKRDIKSLAARGVNLKGLDFDIMIAAYLLDPGKRDYSKEKIIFDYLGYRGAGKIENEKDVKEKINEIGDAVLLDHFFELYQKLGDDLKKADMEDLFYKIEMPLIKVLSGMEICGVKIDKIILKNLSAQMNGAIDKLSKKIHKLSGNDSFNINSSRQLAEVLFEKMKLPVADIKKTQTGYSTAATELEKLRGRHIIIDFISQYRELTKLKNTYVDALPKLTDKETGRLHTTFHQTVTATGRLSSSDPNLQNIPVRTEIGRKIRKSFIAESGRKLLSADYSQIELRIIAMIADDKKMKEIFNKGLDIHAATAAEVNQVPLEKVTSEMRRAAKALNFGVIYGMSVYGFAQSAGIDRDRAKEFIDNYMKKFSSVAAYIEKSKENARKLGYAETLWGRRRYLPELKSSNVMLKNAAERMAINMPIQGTAADIIKIAMIKVDKWLEDYNMENRDAVKLILQVHDELLFSVKKEKIEEAARNIKKIMENGHLEIDGKKIDFPVPIVVDIKTGDNWEEMEEIER